MLIQQLAQTTQEYFSPGDTFIVGVSGGVDSMTLMYCLSQLKEYRFIVVTIDHGIRKTSHADTQLVKKTSKEWGLECIVQKVKVPTIAKQQRKGIEEAARDLRYEVFKKQQKKYRAKAIITAHHQDDQIETILLHLLRGSDLHGLIGMKMLNESDIFRPLLSVSKKTIITFAQKQKITWHEDHTNQDIDLTRNLIRHHLVPEFPSDLLLKISKQSQETIGILDQWVNNWIKTNCTMTKKHLSFAKKSFQQLPLYLQFYLLHHLTKQYLQLNHLSFSWLSGVYQWLINAHGQSSYKYQNKVIYSHKKGSISLFIHLRRMGHFQ